SRGKYQFHFLFSLGGFRFDCFTQYRVLFCVFFINGSVGGRIMLSKLSSLDTLAFTERGEELSSKCSVTLFSRAIEGLPKQDKAQMIDWQLRGETDSAGHRLLRVRLEGAIRLECQRCLEAFDYPVQTENAFLLVESESELAIGEDDPEALER